MSPFFSERRNRLRMGSDASLHHGLMARHYY